mgnify:CR=1 FL=1
MKLHRQNVPILGTSPVSIDRAENRHKFSAMLDQLGIDQPRWGELTTQDEIDQFIEKVGFPVLIRPKIQIICKILKFKKIPLKSQSVVM